jgi:hypothetical protein
MATVGNIPIRRKSAQIQSLAQQMQTMGKAVSWWTTVGLSLAATTAVAATLYSRFVNAQSAELKADYIALAGALKQADESIRDTQLQLQRMNEASFGSHQNVEEANLRTQELSVKAEELKLKSISAELLLEKERNQRLDLEKALAPRILPKKRDEADRWNYAPLTPFSGTPVIVRYLPDAEATRAANDLVETLKAAGWRIISASPDPRMWAEFFDGVLVQTSLQSSLRYIDGDHSEQSSSTLLGFLHDNGWEARKHADESQLGDGCVQVSIGFKPNPYFPGKLQDKSVESEVRAATKVHLRDDHW